MAVYVNCPDCKTRRKVPENFRGVTLNCRECGASISTADDPDDCQFPDQEHKDAQETTLFPIVHHSRTVAASVLLLVLVLVCGAFIVAKAHGTKNQPVAQAHQPVLPMLNVELPPNDQVGTKSGKTTTWKPPPATPLVLPAQPEQTPEPQLLPPRQWADASREWFTIDDVRITVVYVGKDWQQLMGDPIGPQGAYSFSVILAVQNNRSSEFHYPGWGVRFGSWGARDPSRADNCRFTDDRGTIIPLKDFGIALPYRLKKEQNIRPGVGFYDWLCFEYPPGNAKFLTLTLLLNDAQAFVFRIPKAMINRRPANPIPNDISPFAMSPAYVATQWESRLAEGLTLFGSMAKESMTTGQITNPFGEGSISTRASTTRKGNLASQTRPTPGAPSARTIKISGYIRDRSGRAVANSPATFYGDGLDGGGEKTHTDNNGFYTLTTLRWIDKVYIPGRGGVEALGKTYDVGHHGAGHADINLKD